MSFNFSFLKKNIRINAATVVIAAILFYFIFQAFKNVNEKPISVYRVNESTISNNILLDGIALREEKIINSNTTGYVCYYVRDGEKVKKSASLCSIDSTGQIYSNLEDENYYSNLLEAEDYKEIRSSISLYKVSYNDNQFYSSYNFENNINNKVVELSNEILMQEVGGYSNGSSLSHTSSPDSGLVTYYIDGYENLTVDNISQNDFDASHYEKKSLKTGDQITSNSPIIKLIPSEDWNIVAPLTEDQANTLQEIINNQLNPEDKSIVPKLSFYINNSFYSITMPSEIIYKEDGAYLNISLNKYLTNYLSERFLSIEIVMDDDIGLKVPVSAIIEKDVYKIPLNYLSKGGGQDSAENKFNVRVTDPETGDISLKQVSPTIYKKDNEYCYVEMSDFNQTDVLFDYNTDDTASISLVSVVKLPGVYVVNYGFTVFRQVEVLKTIDEFSLIKIGQDLTSFDNIVLDASTIKENQIIGR